MTPELLQKEALEKWRVYPAYLSVEPLLNELIAKAFLAGEKSGRNKAVDYVEAHSSSRIVKRKVYSESVGALELVNEAEYHVFATDLEKARTS